MSPQEAEKLLSEVETCPQGSPQQSSQGYGQSPAVRDIAIRCLRQISISTMTRPSVLFMRCSKESENQKKLFMVWASFVGSFFRLELCKRRGDLLEIQAERAEIQWSGLRGWRFC